MPHSSLHFKYQCSADYPICQQQRLSPKGSTVSESDDQHQEEMVVGRIVPPVLAVQVDCLDQGVADTRSEAGWS